MPDSTSEFGTFEEAKICPRCKMTGESLGKNKGPVGTAPGTQMHIFRCNEPGCPWEGTNWTVQVNPDGTIPIRKDEPRRPKYHPVDRAMMKQVQDSVAAQHQRSIELGRANPLQ